MKVDHLCLDSNQHIYLLRLEPSLLKQNCSVHLRLDSSQQIYLQQLNLPAKVYLRRLDSSLPVVYLQLDSNQQVYLLLLEPSLLVNISRSAALGFQSAILPAETGS
jgi:hypothetical protein